MCPRARRPRPTPVIATLTGAQGVAKIGNGELVLDNPLNDYQGSTKVLAGTLSISVDAANGCGALGDFLDRHLRGQYHAATATRPSTSMRAASPCRATLWSRPAAPGPRPSAPRSPAGRPVTLGDITLQDSAVLSAPAGSSVTFGGDFSGDGGVTLNGPGSFTLSGHRHLCRADDGQHARAHV